MSFVYNHFKFLRGQAATALTAGTYRAILVMSNTTADTQDDATSVGGFSTLDEFDGAGYTSGGLALTGLAWTKDAANDRSIFDADDPQWPALSPGTRSIVGCLVVDWQGSLGASIPVAFIDGTGFPYTANGNGVRVTLNPAGVLYFGN